MIEVDLGKLYNYRGHGTSGVFMLNTCNSSLPLTAIQWPAWKSRGIVEVNWTQEGTKFICIFHRGMYRKVADGDLTPNYPPPLIGVAMEKSLWIGSIAGFNFLSAIFDPLTQMRQLHDQREVRRWTVDLPVPSQRKHRLRSTSFGYWLSRYQCARNRNRNYPTCPSNSIASRLHVRREREISS